MVLTTHRVGVAMICGSCGASNRAGPKFCSTCGTRLESACPTCGSPVEPGARFCADCGTPMGSGTPTGATDPGTRPTTGPSRAPGALAAPSAQPSGVLAERRLVSVLLTDLVGFTTFAQGRDAEDVRETLGRYFELATDIIGRYGGTVEKFIGEAVMAGWGAPTAHEGDAQRGGP